MQTEKWALKSLKLGAQAISFQKDHGRIAGTPPKGHHDNCVLKTFAKVQFKSRKLTFRGSIFDFSGVYRLRSLPITAAWWSAISALPWPITQLCNYSREILQIGDPLVFSLKLGRGLNHCG